MTTTTTGSSGTEPTSTTLIRGTSESEPDYIDRIIENLGDRWFQIMGNLDHEEKRRVIRRLWPPPAGDESTGDLSQTTRDHIPTYGYRRG